MYDTSKRRILAAAVITLLLFSACNNPATGGIDNPSSNATLASLSIESTNIILVSGSYEYTADEVASTVSSVSVSATPEDSNASAVVTGDTDLAAGWNTLTITVTAEDGETVLAYTVNILKRGVTITSPSSGATVNTISFTVSGSYYGSAAPDSMTLTFGGTSTVSVETEDIQEPTDGTGTWSVEIEWGNILESDRTRGNKVLLAEAVWDSDIASHLRSIDYQYESAATGYSLSGTISTSEEIPEGNTLYVYLYAEAAVEGDPPRVLDIH